MREVRPLVRRTGGSGMSVEVTTTYFAECPGCGARDGDRYGPKQVCWSCWERQQGAIGSRSEPRTAGNLTVRQADLGRSEPPSWAWLDRTVIGYLNLLLSTLRSTA